MKNPLPLQGEEKQIESTSDISPRHPVPTTPLYVSWHVRVLWRWPGPPHVTEHLDHWDQSDQSKNKIIEHKSLLLFRKIFSNFTTMNSETKLCSKGLRGFNTTFKCLNICWVSYRTNVKRLLILNMKQMFWCFLYKTSIILKVNVRMDKCPLGSFALSLHFSPDISLHKTEYSSLLTILLTRNMLAMKFSK